MYRDCRMIKKHSGIPLSEIVYTRRKALKLSQEDIEKLTGGLIKQQTVGKIENGKNKSTT